MAVRPTWKGLLKLSLIAIPVRAYPATNPSSDVSFHQVHRKCHTRIRLKKWCPHCEREVEADEIVKGFEREKGRYVLVEKEEIAAVRPKSSETVDLTHLVPASVVDPIYIERAYFLGPDTKAAGSPFAVVREGLDDRAAIGRFAQHGREYLVAVVPRDKALMLYTLRTAGEVRDLTSVPALDYADARVKAEEVKLARQVLNSFETDIDLSQIADNYQVALRRMLKAKGSGEPIAEPEEAEPTKVVNLMDALRKSLDKVTAEKKRPARATGTKRGGKVLKHAAGRRRAS